MTQFKHGITTEQLEHVLSKAVVMWLVLSCTLLLLATTILNCPIHLNISALNPTYKSFLAGCCDWKNALSKFKAREISKVYRDSIYAVNQQGKLSVREHVN